MLEEQEPESPDHQGIKGLIEDLHGLRGQDHPDGELQVSEESSDSTSRQEIKTTIKENLTWILGSAYISLKSFLSVIFIRPWRSIQKI